jgi:uncharacterized membrane protein YphA (DoxX/SURF4 family)
MFAWRLTLAMSLHSGWAREREGIRRSLLGPEPETMRHWLAFLRMALGALYLNAFIVHLPASFRSALPGRLQGLAANHSLAAGRWLLTRMAAPHASSIAWILLAAEGLIGALLLLGLATRVAAVVGLALQLCCLFAMLGGGNASIAGNLFLLASLLVIIGTDGGFRWSLDELIVNRR